jgi:succinate dehydrogenase flavoprotein subunit
VETPYGAVVHLDLRHLGEKVIESRLPMVRELCLKYERIDPVKELIPVRPVVHYMMGGVHTDMNGATDIEGLYAAGEVACVSINGANRLGSNSLPECLVFGRRAGEHSADLAAATGFTAEPPAAIVAQAADEHRRLENDLLNRNGTRGERIADLRTEMQQTMEDGAGIYRTGESLEKAAGRLSELQERFGAVSLDDSSLTFNTELVAALELGCMLDVAQCIVHSAWRREESRGAHQRLDFPTRDDERYLAHSVVTRAPDGTPQVEYQPVTITRLPPGQRVYGR